MLDVLTIHERPAELLQALLRFDTTNPPGTEAECIHYIAELLMEADIEHYILGREPGRPNVVARLPGRGVAPPLLLYGHVDVVTTAHQDWTHDPFSGDIADGFVWGRGALDMKGGVAMMLAALLRMRASGEPPPGDVIFAAVCDEEYSGYYGAQYLVEEHANLFANVRYALGEFGGFTSYIGGRIFYPIMVGEKQSCQMRATVRGPGGHGSLTMRGGATARLARFLTTLDKHGLPPHVTTVSRMMI
ncbi:MAG TPA: M20/M25/M40 family metallo-hydrolase, partial [Ktedonobacterales bacterium]|nr:M20/M25/M40 family metallo-hydrolase [Ktedonobacterales bacterium]